MTRVANLLASARVAELRAQAENLARAARPPARVELPQDPRQARRRLLLLVALERQRTARLLAELVK
jgi:hypothetical protein